MIKEIAYGTNVSYQIKESEDRSKVIVSYERWERVSFDVTYSQEEFAKLDLVQLEPNTQYQIKKEEDNVTSS